jgi:outer membrane protein assembly factor BamB
MSAVGPTVADGTVYVGNGDGVVFAFDERGDRQWRSDLGGSVESSVALDGRLGYVVVRDLDTDVVDLVAFDRQSGDVAWRYELRSDRPYSALRGQPVAVDGTVYVSGETFGPDAEPRRFVVAVSDGTERWRHGVGGDRLTAPAVVRGTVYVGAADHDTETGRVVALDAATGTPAWETPIQAQPAAPPVVVGERVYVASWSNVTVLDAADGTILRHLGVAAGSDPISVTEDTVYAVEDDALVAVDATTGVRRWTAAEPFVETPPVVAGNAVVVGANGAVVGLDPATGQRLWAYVVDERVGLGAHLAVADGTVYVGPSNRRLYALGEGGTAAPGGLVGQVTGAILSDAFLGAVAALAGASVVAGLVAGTVVLVLTRLLGYSWAVPHLLAARLLRRPYADTGRAATVTVHYLVSIVVPFVAGAVYLGGSILVATVGVPALPILGGGLMFTAAFLLVAAAATWLALDNRLLPAAADLTDVPRAALRRQSAVALGTYVAVTAVVFPVVLFLALMLVFFR